MKKRCTNSKCRKVFTVKGNDMVVCPWCGKKYPGLGGKKSSFAIIPNLYRVVMTGDGGQKVEAIKFIREYFGIGEKEAKSLVNQLSEKPVVLKDNLIYAEACAVKDEIIPNLYRVVMMGYDDFQKVKAIKFIREYFGMELRNAKGLVDQLSEKPIVLKDDLTYAEACNVKDEVIKSTNGIFEIKTIKIKPVGKVEVIKKEKNSPAFIIPNVYRVVMKGDGCQKVKAIEFIREYFGIGEKEAKSLADQLSEKSIVLKDNLTYPEACAVKDEIIPNAYRVVMTGDGSHKVKAIKFIRKYFGMELKEAKGLVDQLSEKPVVLKDNLTYPEACTVRDEIIKSTDGSVEIEIINGKPIGKIEVIKKEKNSPAFIIPNAYRAVMTSDGRQKVKAIKFIREYFGMELKEAKGLVDQLSEKPVVLKDDLTYAEACAVKDEIIKSTYGIVEIEIIKIKPVGKAVVVRKEVKAPQVVTGKIETENMKSKKEIQNPRIVPDDTGTMKSGQKVTWDCVWFGNYPQTEVVSEKDTEKVTALKNMNQYYETKYEIFSASKFAQIEKAVYDINGDATVGSEKYRRIKYSDATRANIDKDAADGYYDWDSEDSYHYFKYEPMKWRVLKVENGEALLLADLALDDQQYNTELKDVTWEKSTIRSFLNNYGCSANAEERDYTSNGFLNNAFTPSERSLIKTSKILSINNVEYE